MTFNLHLIYNFQGVTGHGYYAISGSLLVLGSVCGMAASDWLEAKLMKKKNLKVTPQSEIIRFEGSDIAINTGLYTFSFTQNGKKVKVPARFTFVYEKDDGKWEIEDHHSSMLPIKGQAKKVK